MNPRIAEKAPARARTRSRAATRGADAKAVTADHTWSWSLT
ncbi:hypothetical protein [Streptomyces sp. NPDC048357]